MLREKEFVGLFIYFICFPKYFRFSCWGLKSFVDWRLGIPWTEEEHKLFLLGLQKVGKGDWRGISRNFVKTRTPTQVASHAQKYFLRRNNHNRRRRRSSLFDITNDTVTIASHYSALSLISLVPEKMEDNGRIKNWFFSPLLFFLLLELNKFIPFTLVDLRSTWWLI